MCRFPECHHLALCGITGQNLSPYGGSNVANQLFLDFDPNSAEDDDDLVDRTRPASQGRSPTTPGAMQPTSNRPSVVAPAPEAGRPATSLEEVIEAVDAVVQRLRPAVPEPCVPEAIGAKQHRQRDPAVYEAANRMLASAPALV